MRREAVGLMPDEVDDGAAYVRAGMRPPTDAELDAEIRAEIAAYGHPNDDLFEALAALCSDEADSSVSHESGLPGCHPRTRSTINLADIEASPNARRRDRRQLRRSRAADAKLIERKRAAELAAEQVSCTASKHVEKASGRVPPIEEGTEEGTNVGARSKSGSELETGPGICSSATEEIDEKEATKPSFVAWFRKTVDAYTTIDDEGRTSYLSSIQRKSDPRWGDLCDEARLDFYQDAGVALAATRPSHALYRVDINLERDIEKRAISKPNALEWCKYRIATALDGCALPPWYLIVSEEAYVKDLVEIAKREDLGLHPTRRFHLHMLTVLPKARRAHQKLRDALRIPAVLGRWADDADHYQVKICRGDLRVHADYLSKDLWLAGARFQRYDRLSSSNAIKCRNYSGGSITVSDELRLEAKKIYERWRNGGPGSLIHAAE